MAASASSGKRAVMTPRAGARMHQQRDRVKGRPWLDKKNAHQEVPHGAIFAYEYLEPEQTFCGVIQVSGKAIKHIDHIKSLLSQPLLIGRSRRAGYGGDAIIEFRADTSCEYSANVSGSLRESITSGDHFRLMLVSAYVGRHPATGQLDPMALDEELAALLPVDIERRCWAFETVGSFNRKWRLEVPQAPAVKAGAVLVLEAREDITLERLRKVECAGLGETRGEGVGRALVLVHSEHSRADNVIGLTRDSLGRQRPPATTITKPSNSAPQLRFLEERIVLTAARTAIEQLGARIATRPEKAPASSLLNRIRTIFRQVHNNETATVALEKLAVWCSSEDEDKNKALRADARQKLDGCVIDKDTTLINWLKSLSDKTEDDGTANKKSGEAATKRKEATANHKKGWDQLVKATSRASSLTGLAQRHHLTDKDVAQTILQQHSALLRVHLIDTVLATMDRRNRGGAQ